MNRALRNVPCRRLPLFGALSLFLCGIAPGAQETALISGQWMIAFDRGGPEAELTLQRHSRSHGHHSNSFSLPLASIGLARPPAAAGPARFELVRDAGSFTFQGQWSPEGGGGGFVFAPDAAFRAAVREMGYGDLTLEQQFGAASHDVSRAFLRELAALGYGKASFDDWIALRIHGAGPEFIRDLKALGYDRLSVDDLVGMRIHGATADFIRRLSEAGLSKLQAQDLVAMRIHQVTPELVKELALLRYRPPAEELVAMRIPWSVNGVRPRARRPRFRAPLDK